MTNGAAVNGGEGGPRGRDFQTRIMQEGSGWKSTLRRWSGSVGDRSGSVVPNGRQEAQT